MPDQLRSAPSISRLVARVLVILAGAAVLGGLLGVVWEIVWEAPPGTAYQGEWYLAPAGLGDDVAATGWFALLGLGGGLLLGVVSALTARGRELATLLGVCLGSVLAAWVMFHVGHAIGPPDPHAVAKDAADMTSIPSDLRLIGASTKPWPFWFESSAFNAFPIGGLLGLVVVFLGRSPRRESVG